jgi:two-component system, LytTR family, sensor kinase
MKSKLYKMALITSPIIAIYGVLPFFVFKIVEPKEILFLASGLALNTFLAWVILINLKVKFPNLNNILLFLASYGINILIRLVVIVLMNPFDFIKPPIDDKYFAYPIATSFALNAVIIVIINSIYFSYKNANAERELQEIKLQNSEAQKQLLMQQLQPHFLFNALSTLKSLISVNTEVAENYTVKLSEFLRYSIQNKNVEVISLEKELQFTLDYIDLQKMRFEDSFEYSIDIPDQCLNYKVPILALQTLVENIFKHNYFTAKNKLTFSISCNGQELTVFNKKVSVKVTERTQTGLNNLNKRYQLVCDEAIKIEENDDSFSVTIPLIKQ